MTNLVAPEERAQPKIPKNQVVYVLDLDGYATKHNNVYDVANLRSKEAVENYIVGLGYSAIAAKNYMKFRKYIKVRSIRLDAKKPELFVARDGESYINSYTQPRIQPIKGDFDLVRRVLDFITDGDEVGLEWLLNWSAAKVQNPTVSPGTALILAGAQGTGKSTYAATIMPLILGEENCTIIDQSSLDNQFTSHFATKIWVNADEATSSENAFEVSSKLKSFITSSTLDYHMKGRPNTKVENCASFVFTTNAQIPVRLDSDDRRYTAFMQSNRPEVAYTSALKSAHVFKSVSPEFEREISAFYAYLLDYKVDKVKVNTAYESSAKREIQALSRPNYEAFYEAVYEAGPVALSNDLRRGSSKYLDDKVETFNNRVETLLPDGRRHVSQSFHKQSIYKLYREYCESTGTKSFGSIRLFVALSKYPGVTERRHDNKRYIELPWVEDITAPTQDAQSESKAKYTN